MKDAGTHQAFVRFWIKLGDFWTKEIDSCSIRRFCHLTGVATVATKECVIFVNIEVDGSFISFEMIPGAFPGFDLVAGKVEYLAFRHL
jgi:hypothetical protein